MTVARRNVLIVAAAIFIMFFVVVPILPEGWPSGTYSASFHYDCPPGDTKVQGLPLPYTMSMSYSIFKVGFVYDPQLNPPLAFETTSTISHATSDLINAQNPSRYLR